MAGARIERLVTSGTFSLDGGTWDVDNNVWIVGNDAEVIVIDPAHDATAIRAAVGDRRTLAVLLTHGHDDHIRAARETAALLGAPIHLHPSDRMLWDAVYSDAGPDADIADGDAFEVAGVTLTALHTPGHSPGSVSFVSPALAAVFTGDTLFQGGPGATGRSYSDFPTIIASIRDRLLTLPAETRVHTGHGYDTTIAAEAPELAAWIARGH
ncbi:glyoxylase-like metal-dependent hydrolase (beta-lactamase superfamily II) [Leucobacter luti]|uniref:MBL fold metallo-hydrolase n=1 Tax=Leucobacter luti TaxID=340320 RepID=UPI001045CD78|nr:MBL fold metallo-hydrolase [Leucobacter luti]MCW2288315.1 glyoxylase-like metal-dependent hydrolase (beta-lactamase superfamily II) [Leucobacter luti]TCK45528.1 glyoxylase-like metal-dependent hydrolase (beta-lactamase superfamily II) [Leucobacter luti]